MIPGAVIGTLIGLATFRMLSNDAMRLLVGAMALVIAVAWYIGPPQTDAKPASMLRGTFWSTLSGFTSFGIHAGGPPIQAYLLSQQLDKSLFQATTVAFFFVVNWLKLPAYAWLDQLDLNNLSTSLILAPLAPLGIWIGRRRARPHRRKRVLSRHLRIADRHRREADLRRRVLTSTRSESRRAETRAAACTSVRRSRQCFRTMQRA